MISYWHHYVARLSVYLSACLSVTLCIVTLKVFVLYRAKSCTSVFLACKFLFVRSELRTLLLQDVSFSHKTYRKTSRRKRERELFLRQTIKRALSARIIVCLHWSRYVLLFTDFVNYCHAHWSRFSR